MNNELLFFIAALVNVSFIFFVARRGTSWLLGSVVVNLILVSIFGAKLVEVFGLTTNAGNIFYACVFLATHFILERQGRHEGYRTMHLGFAFMIFFIIMSQLVARFVGLFASSEVNNAIQVLFSFSWRVALASLLAYVFAQSLNIWLYESFRRWTKGKMLWLRSNVANILSQFLDSLLFFSIVFFDLPGPLLLQAILVGWLIKTGVVLLGTPLLYLDAYWERKKL